jgi:hypothetical protein
MGWSAPLDKVFVPRKGKQIKTLAGAYAYLLKLLKCRHTTAGIGTVLNGRSSTTARRPDEGRHAKLAWKFSPYSQDK